MEVECMRHQVLVRREMTEEQFDLALRCTRLPGWPAQPEEVTGLRLIERGGVLVPDLLDDGTGGVLLALLASHRLLSICALLVEGGALGEACAVAAIRVGRWERSLSPVYVEVRLTSAGFQATVWRDLVQVAETADTFSSPEGAEAAGREMARLVARR